MKTNLTRTLLALAVLALTTACDRPKSAAAVDRDVAEKQTEVAKDMAETRRDALGTMASARKDAQKEIQDAGRDAAQAQADEQQAAADATYSLAMERTAGERDVALEKCEALTNDQRKTCKERASAEFAAAEAKAEQDRAAQVPLDQ
jgi:hypothetical protein